MSDYRTPIVVDLGSHFIKAGFSGDDSPTVVFPTVVGRPNTQGLGAERYYIGDETIMKQNLLALSRPIVDGVITGWDDFKIILEYLFFNQLRVDPTQHPVLVTERSFNPLENRRMLAQVLFEHFNVPAMYIANSAVLGLLAVGKTDGLVVDSGYDVTDITPVCQGFAIPGASARLHLGGRHVTDYLSKSLNQLGYSAVVPRHEIVENIKKGLCFLVPSIDAIETNADYDYELPNGEFIIIGKEQMQAPEVLMRPTLIGSDSHGIPELLFQVAGSDLLLRRTMYANILLVGGNTLFSGMDNRIQSEVAIFEQEMHVQVTASPERQYVSWIGGSILTSLHSFESRWFFEEDYMEHGASFIDRVCPTGPF